jgi:hypothetical protein
VVSPRSSTLNVSLRQNVSCNIALLTCPPSACVPLVSRNRAPSTDRLQYIAQLVASYLYWQCHWKVSTTRKVLLPQLQRSLPCFTVSSATWRTMVNRTSRVSSPTDSPSKYTSKPLLLPLYFLGKSLLYANCAGPCRRKSYHVASAFVRWEVGFDKANTPPSNDN